MAFCSMLLMQNSASQYGAPHYTHLAWSYQVMCQSNAEFHGSTVTHYTHLAWSYQVMCQSNAEFHGSIVTHYTHLAWSYQVMCQSNAEFHGSIVTLMLHEADRAHLHDADASRHSGVCTRPPSLSSSDSNTAHTHRPSLYQPTTHTDHMPLSKLIIYQQA